VRRSAYAAAGGARDDDVRSCSFRTWEALALGVIPIVHRAYTPFDAMFEDLPVLIVDRWSDITLDLLLATLDAFRHKKFEADKLLSEWWVRSIRKELLVL
jgi:hypothetical protein